MSAVYCASKAAVDQFTRTTALELASHKVRCNAVNPGTTKTEIFKTVGFSEEQAEGVFMHCFFYESINS